MGKYDPGKGPYEVRYGLLTPDMIPASFTVADWVHKKNEQQFQFYSRLEESVKREGFRNPIMVYEKPGERTFPYGGSRVYVAHKLQIPVPAIVSDWVGTFSHWEKLETVDQVLAKFKDPPTVVEFHPWAGCQFWGCAQVHLADEHRTMWAERQRKNDLHHMKRRMTEGQFYYAATGERS